MTSATVTCGWLEVDSKKSLRQKSLSHGRALTSLGSRDGVELDRSHMPSRAARNQTLGVEPVFDGKLL